MPVALVSWNFSYTLISKTRFKPQWLLFCFTGGYLQPVGFRQLQNSNRLLKFSILCIAFFQKKRIRSLFINCCKMLSLKAKQRRMGKSQQLYGSMVLKLYIQVLCTPCNTNVISLHSVTLMICFHGNFFSKKAQKEH